MATPLCTLLVFILFILSSASSHKAMYDSWLALHHKAYNRINEREERFEIFKNNLRFIEEHNSQNRSYKVGLNRFADLTNEEYRQFLGTRNEGARRVMKVKKASRRYAFSPADWLPTSVDWRARGAVNPIKTKELAVSFSYILVWLQKGPDRSCWAFSTVAAVEGINQIVTGELISLSEQELVDCDKTYNSGCNGGLMDYAFQFIVDNGGMDSEQDYPYDGADGKCDPTRKNSKVVSIDGYEDVPAYDEQALKNGVAHQPVSVAIEAGGRALQLYQSGVFTGECGTSIDHGVVVVGYGVENNIDYWLVRNSWGSDWGENGYFKLERNLVNSNSGKCGIAMEASYPIKTIRSPVKYLPEFDTNSDKISLS